MADVDIDITGAELPALSTAFYGGDSVVLANLPRLESTVSVDTGTATSLEANLPSLQVTLSTGPRVTATLQPLESKIVGAVNIACTVSADLKPLGATAFSGIYVSSTLKKLSATVDIEVTTMGEVLPILPRLGATVNTDVEINGDVTYTLKPLQATLAGAGISISDDSVAGVITSSLNALKTEMESIGSADITFAQELPALEAYFEAMLDNNIDITSTLPSLSSTVLQEQSYTYSDAEFTRTC